MAWPLAPSERFRSGLSRKDYSLRRRMRAEEGRVEVCERVGVPGSGWRNLGRESFAGCFCLRLKEKLGYTQVKIPL